MNPTRPIHFWFRAASIGAGSIAAPMLLGTAAFASNTATLRLSAPKIEVGTSVVIKGTATPHSGLRYDHTYATVVLYEVGKTSDTQLGGEEQVPANGRFTFTQPAAAGTPVYSVQLMPVGGMAPVSATIKITLKP